MKKCQVLLAILAAIVLIAGGIVLNTQVAVANTAWCGCQCDCANPLGSCTKYQVTDCAGTYSYTCDLYCTYGPGK